MSVMQNLNQLSHVFFRSISDIQLVENRDEQMVHVKRMADSFTQVLEMAEAFSINYEKIKAELGEMTTKCIYYEGKAESYDLAVKQIHLLSNARTLKEHKNNLCFQKLSEEVQETMERAEKKFVVFSATNLLAVQNERLVAHVNELSKKLVMQRIGSRFYAREVALVRQMMDLLRNAHSIEAAEKSKVWDQLESETQILRNNTLWLINRINGEDRAGNNAYHDLKELRSSPRVVILVRSYKSQILGIDIKGENKGSKGVCVTAKLEGSMADVEELNVGDRIIAIDGTFVTASTTHDEVMELLRIESTKDYIALIVSSFDPFVKVE